MADREGGPAEEEAHEGRLRKNAIRPDRERHAEDVADVVRVVGPVGANWNSMVIPVVTPIAKLMPKACPRTASSL